MSERTFPRLEPSLGLQLKAIALQMEVDPGYLADERCPYPAELREQLRRLVSREAVVASVEATFSEGQTQTEATDSLIEEIQAAINLMKKITTEMDRDGADVKERMDWLKNYGNLVDRYLGLKEKAQGSKAMIEFQRIVLTAMEQVMSKDQIFELKKKLRAAGIETDDDRDEHGGDGPH